jgi:hypothetical protein
MTDFVVSARLTADASDLVAGAGQGTAAIDRLAGSSGKAGGPVSRLSGFTRDQAAQMRVNAAAIGEVVRATHPAVAATGALDRAVKSAERAYIAGKIGAETYSRAVAIAARASAESVAAGTRNVQNLGAQRAAYTQIGFQIQDVSQQAALGINPFVILAQQGGQLASALQQMFEASGNSADGLAKQGRAAIANSVALGRADRATASLEGKTFQLAVADRAAVPAMSGLTAAAAVNAGAMKADEVATNQNAAAKSRLAIAGAAAARFFAGPWGSALLAGVAVLGLFASRSGSAADATDEHAAASRQAISAVDALGQAQSVLGQIFDLSTGKIRSNTEALRANAIMTALNLRVQSQQQINRTAFPMALGQRVGGYLDGLSPGQLLAARAIAPESMSQLQNLRNIAINAGLIPGRRTGAPISRSEAIRQLGLADTSRLPISGMSLAGVLNEREQGEEGLRIANEALEAIRTGRLGERFRQRSSGGGGRRQRRGADQTEFGEDTADRITALSQRFTDTPPQVEAVRRGLADLNDLMTDIEQRKPPNYLALLAQARAARPIIEAGINKPYNDFIAAQEESLRIGALQARGRSDEAEALTQILRLEQQQGPLNAQQREAILANVSALREQQRAVQLLQERQQLYLNTLGETRKGITAIAEAVLGGDAGALIDLPGQLRQSFNRLTAERFVEMTFGPAFRQLEDEITGRNRVRQANEQLATTTDTATAAVASTTGALGDATGALGEFTGALRGAAGAATAPLSGAAQNLAVWNGQAAPANIPNVLSSTGMDAIARGWFNTTEGLGGDQEQIVQAIRSPLITNPRAFFEKMVTGLLTGLLGEQLAGLIGKGVSRGLEGAAMGAMAGGALGSLGIRTSGTGSQLGGAVGNLLGGKFLGGIGSMLGIGGGPLGSILGGLLGGVLPGLFGGSQRGSATITSVDGAVSTRGNNADFRSQSSGLAGGIQNGLQQIAEQLGGQIGAFAVSIGVRDGKFRVDPTGQGRTKTKKGAVDFGDDENAAIMYAIMDAIKDGAVVGLSEAVQKALRSSNDLDKALREALKVDEIETLLRGPIGAIEKQFKDFERQAAERVRIAAKYGFDVLEIEKINAADRLKLEQQVLESRTGALRQLLDDLDFGDLFEGSINDQVARLRKQLASAQAEAEAGVEGAAGRQADLSRSLIALLHEGFGTAGAEYAAGLEQVRSGAERVIDLENQRVKAAMDAAKETNTQLNEANDHLSEQTAVLRGIGGSIENLTAVILDSRYDVSTIDVVRTTQLS